MDGDTSPRRRSIKRVNQEIRNHLNHFTSEAHEDALCLDALIDNNSLAERLGSIKIT